jgi:hypothetical protein
VLGLEVAVPGDEWGSFQKEEDGMRIAFGKKGLFLGVAVLLAVGSAAQADTFTLATFADPAINGTTPLFTYDGATLTGQWVAPGMKLETPGVPAPDFANATFVMTPVAVAGPLGGPTTGGQIAFFDAAHALLMTITFDQGWLTIPFGFGLSDFAMQNVVIAGPIIPFVLEQESAAFSFANQRRVGNLFTATASFTSSAAVPEAGSIGLLAAGVVTLLRRKGR